MTFDNESSCDCKKSSYSQILKSVTDYANVEQDHAFTESFDSMSVCLFSKKKKCNDLHDLPWVMIGLIESYLPASSIVSWSCASRQIHDRWNALRWKRTFHLHYEIPRTIENKNEKSDAGVLKSKLSVLNRWERYHVVHFGEWDKSFIGCCCDECGTVEKVEKETQFNVSSLFPSLLKAYGELWGRIELSMLGYQDMQSNPTNRRRRMEEGANIFSSLVNVIYLLCTPFLELATSVVKKQKKEEVFTTDNAKRIPRIGVDSMCAWKLACILKESGVDCFHCPICHKIDVKMMTNTMETGKDCAWILPCRCQVPVHRKCLEEKLRLNQNLYILEVLKRLLNRGDLWFTRGTLFEENEIAPKIWLSYDQPDEPVPPAIDSNAYSIKLNPACTNELNQFIIQNAKCCDCGEIYERSVRLPSILPEVLFVSLSDPLAISRAFSTFAHFLLCIFCIAFIEGRCDDVTCEDNVIIWDGWFQLQWPNTRWKGFALAWWQLQQSCMLHILCSPRFAAVVDQLWRHTNPTFYIRLYIYFVLTSIVLAVSYIPAASRMLRNGVCDCILSDEKMTIFSPLWDFTAIGTLFHYAISSTTVIAIFWRTNYRMYTIANRTGINDESAGHLQDGDNFIRHHVERRDEHPIYHGQWR